MSTYLEVTSPDGQIADVIRLTKPVRERIRQAREHRRQYEATWQSNMAFASGKHWLVYDHNTRSLRRIQDLDPNYRSRELYTADVITEYRTTVLGELGSDDDRPELLIQQENVFSQDYQEQINRAIGYGWDYEWDGDDVLAEADRLCVDLGTSAIRCRFDPTTGPVAEDSVPHQNGLPILGEDAHAKVAQAAEQGQTLQYRPIKSGRITWEPLSAFNIIVPPGVTHERNLPWECVVRPTPIAQVQAEYGQIAMQLREDTDIGSTLGISTSGVGQGIQGMTDQKRSRLRDHVWLFTYYERPTSQFPCGRTFVFAGNDLKLIDYKEMLPYVGPDGEYRSGIAYFHWWRVTGRFFSRALVEALKDGQFSMNKRRTQINEIIDRGMPYVFIDKNSQSSKRTNLPLEFIRLDPAERPPQVVEGIGPGPWMEQEIAQIREDLEHASGVRASTLGENPTNVTTYSQLALLRENDQVKRQPIQFGRKLSIARLIEDSVYDMRVYWGQDKQIAIAGPEGAIEAHVFNASKIPPFFIVKVAKGTSKPRSQAAELQKIQDIANYSLTSQQPLPVRWYYESLEHGQPMQLPADPSNSQNDKAELENHFLLDGSQDVQVAYYDPPEVHIPIHREAQIQAEVTGDVAAWKRIEAHVQRHEQIAQENMQIQQAQQMQAIAQAPVAGVPGQPGEPSPQQTATPPEPQPPEANQPEGQNK